MALRFDEFDFKQMHRYRVPGQDSIEPYEGWSRHGGGGGGGGGGSPSEAAQDTVYWSHWYHFSASLDKESDANLLKELLYWSFVYHRNDSVLNILHPARAPEHLTKFRRLFGVDNYPTLVLADNSDTPNDFVTLSPGFLSEDVLGKNLEGLRNLLEQLHALVVDNRGLRKAKTDIVRKRIQKVLGKGWDQAKSLISISISEAE